MPPARSRWLRSCWHFFVDIPCRCPTIFLGQEPEISSHFCPRPDKSWRKRAMANDPVPNIALPPKQPWFARLGMSGKLLLFGAVAGIIAAFLPLAAVSVELQGPGGANIFPIPGFQGKTNQP